MIYNIILSHHLMTNSQPPPKKFKLPAKKEFKKPLEKQKADSLLPPQPAPAIS